MEELFFICLSCRDRSSWGELSGLSGVFLLKEACVSDGQRCWSGQDYCHHPLWWGWLLYRLLPWPGTSAAHTTRLVGWEHSQDTGSWMAIIHAALEEKSDFAPCKATRQNPEQKSGAEPSYSHVACVLYVIGMSWYTLP